LLHQFGHIRLCATPKRARVCNEISVPETRVVRVGETTLRGEE
jgi:hypothetical protein